MIVHHFRRISAPGALLETADLPTDHSARTSLNPCTTALMNPPGNIGKYDYRAA